MDNNYYNMICKRKSFHKFKDVKNLTESEIEAIELKFTDLVPLVDNIRTEFCLVHGSKKGEYDIQIYSEVADYYLQNIGYMGEQLDLWLASKNIGACWYGMGKTNEKQRDGLKFVIMIAIGKVEESEFRKDVSEAERKDGAEIWIGKDKNALSELVKYAPSACNFQPWLVESEDANLKIYSAIQKHLILTKAKCVFFSKIDIGIFLLFTEIIMEHKGIKFVRELKAEGEYIDGKLLTAIYSIN